MRIKLPGSEQILYAANILADRIFAPGQRPELRRILLVKLDEIGDMATCTHVFELLRSAYPEADITLLCKPFVRSLVENDPHLNHILTDIEAWDSPYDAVVELRGTWKTLFRSFRFRPALRLSRAAVRFRHRGRQLHETMTNFETIQALLKPGTRPLKPVLYFSAEDRQKTDAYLNGAGIQRYALIHAGARKKLRQWNPERFALLIRHLHEKHHLDIVFIGSAEESGDVERIRALAGITSHSSLGLFSLSELSCLSAGAAFYAGNESGPLHIAAAFDVPMLAFFGPGVPHVFYPLHPKARVLHHVLACNPCDQVHCVQPENPCISLIEIADACLAADELLGA